MDQRNDCATIAPLLPWYVAGTLAPETVTTIEEHLASCGSCRADLALWRGTSTALARADAAIPHDTQADATWATLARRISASPQETTRRESRRPMRLLHQRSAQPKANSVPMPASQQRRPLWPALLAAIVIVALMVGVFAELAHRSGTGPAGKSAVPPPIESSGCASGHPSVDLSRLTSSGTTLIVEMGRIALPAGGDGWGFYNLMDRQGKDSPGGFLRYHDCTWTPTPAPEHPSWGSVEFDDLAFSGPDDGWAVGIDSSTYQLVAAHYTNGTWHALPEVAAPSTGTWTSTRGPESPASVDRALVYAAANGDAWILTYGKVGMSASTLLHYTHGAWSTIPNFAPDQTITVVDASVDARGNLWVSATSDQQPVLARYAGGAWTTWRDADLGLGPAATDAGAIRVIAANDVWATVDATILHFDGVRWRDATPPGLSDTQFAPGGQATLPVTFTSIGVVAPNDLYFFLETSVSDPTAPPSGPLAWHDINGLWSELPNRLPGITTDPVIYGINDLVMQNATQGWALGAHEKQITSSYTVTFDSLLYYDNGQWTDFGPHDSPATGR